MTIWIDFNELRTQVSLEEVLTKYYALSNLKREGRKLVGPCPIHGGEAARAFSADLDKNLWHCFTDCGGGGNQLDLVARKEGISVREAALKLHEFFVAQAAGMSVAAEAAPVADESSSRPNPPLEVMLELQPDHPYLTDTRGLTPETIAHFGLGYCGKGVLRGCVAIPIHDVNGRLVAYAGRRVKEATAQKRGKYVFPKGFHKESELFNYHRAMATGEPLIVVEGFFGALALCQAGFPSAVATMGSTVSGHQAELLSVVPELIILFDGDEAGQAGTEQLQRLLRTAGTIVRVARLNHGIGPDDLSVRALRWLIRGMKELDLAEVTFRLRLS